MISPATATTDVASGMGLTGARANAYNYANALSKTTPGGFLEPDKQFINGLAASGASAKEIKAASDAAHLNAISVSIGKNNSTTKKTTKSDQKNNAKNSKVKTKGSAGSAF